MYEKQFEQFGRWGLHFKNKWVMAPMGFIRAEDGGISPQQRAYLAERAKGGFGTIYPSAHTVTNRYEKAGTGNFLCTLSHAARLAQTVEEIHRYGAVFALQLSPGYGRVNSGRPGCTEHVSASDNTVFFYPDHRCRALTIEEIHTLIARMGTAASMAAEAGVDIIELHAYGGYLIDQFMSRIWNRRQDEYGGSLENRLRFFMECYQAVRSAVGKGFPVSVKYTPQHGIPGGRTLADEGIQIAEILDQMDFAFIHLDDGCYECWERAIPTADLPAGSQLYAAEALKKAGIRKPLMVQGRLNDPDLAEDVLQRGTAEFIAVGRQALADPFFPVKVREGREDEIIRCVLCGDCLNTGRKKRPLGCSANPRTAHELEYTGKADY